MIRFCAEPSMERRRGVGRLVRIHLVRGQNRSRHLASPNHRTGNSGSANSV